MYIKIIDREMHFNCKGIKKKIKSLIETLKILQRIETSRYYMKLKETFAVI